MKVRIRPALPALLALVALSLLAGACARGGDGSGGVASLSGQGAAGATTTTTAGSRDPEEAALEFARCMRSHGIDMPDPQVDSNGRTQIMIGGPGRRPPDREKLQAAERACQHLLQNVKGKRGSAQASEKAEREMLAFARCMRAEGFDVPDPQRTENGGLLFDMPMSKDVIDSPRFQQAEEKCRRQHLPDAPGRGERR